MIRELPWRVLAWVLTRPPVTDWLIRRAQRTPYTPITGPDGSLYMGRWWLFNPYPPASDGRQRRWGDLLPSARVHHICRPDSDRHLHDHPWNARTIVLRGGYVEERPLSQVPNGVEWFPSFGPHGGAMRAGFKRPPGYTGRLLFGQYHRIRDVADGGSWTLFITWRYQGTWGFLVEGVKVPWRKYLGKA